MKFGKPVCILSAAFALSLAASGCSFRTDESQAIDPPPNEAAVMMNQTENATSGGQALAAGTAAELYVKDSGGFVIPVSVPLPDTGNRPLTAVQYLIDGGPGTALLPKGFTSLLPKGTKVLGLSVDKKSTATVNLSAEFTHYNAVDERRILEALTWTLTGFPGIEKVKLLVEGQPMPEMPEQATPLDQPLDRSMGINLEIAPGVNPGRSSAVVLYFTNRTEDQFGYYVPVTRLTNRTNDIAKATLEELVKGPDVATGLMTALSADTKVLGVNEADDRSVISADLGSAFLDKDQKASPEAVEAVVLSLTENTKAKQVQLSVNGKPAVSAADNKAYTEPVERPETINPYKS
ncbi:GerMN domain-containing protein [Gorillibacterium timonense]|uniref:GerMN domain-containing protein n=1 Tax=Gorillibacterium timonense TaxID=1689269 RepID=UPI00071CD277|nr:GerMN domain-containing protein [Gorillibacterium timonense]